MNEVGAIDPDEPIEPIYMDNLRDFDDIFETLEEVEKDPPELEERRILLLNNLERLGAASFYLLGRELVTQQKILTAKYEAWEKAKEAGKVADDEMYPHETSVFDWVDNRKAEGKLNFGSRQARRYKKAFEETDQETAEKLGSSKLSVIRQAPEEKRKELREIAIEEKWSVSKLTDEVQKINKKEEKQQTYETEIKPNLPPLSVKLSDNKSELIIKVRQKDRDIVNEILQTKYVDKIKIDLFYANYNPRK